MFWPGTKLVYRAKGCQLSGTIVSDAGEAPGFQLDGGLKFQGMSSSMQLFGWPLAMASRVALSQV